MKDQLAINVIEKGSVVQKIIILSQVLLFGIYIYTVCTNILILILSLQIITFFFFKSRFKFSSVGNCVF